MKELIKISDNNGNHTISAKELYIFLGYEPANWKRWYEKNIINNEFAIENEDWAELIIKTSSNNGIPTKDFALTIDFAKKLAMMSRTEKGEQARQYFIEVEKQYKGQIAPQQEEPPAIVVAKALIEAAKMIDEYKEKIAELQPKANYVDVVLQCKEDLTTGTIAKELGMAAITLNKKLHEKGIQFKNADGVWVLYAKYQAKGFTETRTHVHFNSKGEPVSKIYTVWTQKGRNFIHLLLNPNISTTNVE